MEYKDLFKQELLKTHGDFKQSHENMRLYFRRDKRVTKYKNWIRKEHYTPITDGRERRLINKPSINHINRKVGKIGYQVVKKGIAGSPWGYSNAHYGRLTQRKLDRMMQEATDNSQLVDYEGWDLSDDFLTKFEDEEYELIIYELRDEIFQPVEIEA